MRINYQFKNPDLLKRALTHPSAVKQKDKRELTYERLEFLGDKILSAAIADILYATFHNIAEGKFSLIHSNLVNTESIANIALKVGLDAHIILDNGEEASGGRANPRNLENAMEALIAAIFLDSDYITVKQIVLDLWHEMLQDENIDSKDSKSLLQEWAQKQVLPLPEYIIENKDGADHAPIFSIAVSLNGIGKVCAQGRSIKEAEQLAAKKALEIIATNI